MLPFLSFPIPPNGFLSRWLAQNWLSPNGFLKHGPPLFLPVLAIAGGVAAVAGISAVALNPQWVARAAPAVLPGAVYAADRDDRAIALTLDDGPDPASTPEILAVLARHEVPATFFLIGDRVAGQEDLVRAIAAGGHELGNHLSRDETSLALSDEAFEASLLETDAQLRAVAKPRWLRPGRGFYDADLVAIAERQGYRVALGSVFPLDTHLPSSALARHYINAAVHPGAIVVLHDGGDRGRRTARTLDRVIPDLKRQGYEFLTLSDLFDRAAAEREGNDPDAIAPDAGAPRAIGP